MTNVVQESCQPDEYPLGAGDLDWFEAELPGQPLGVLVEAVREFASPVASSDAVHPAGVAGGRVDEGYKAELGQVKEAPELGGLDNVGFELVQFNCAVNVIKISEGVLHKRVAGCVCRTRRRGLTLDIGLALSTIGSLAGHLKIWREKRVTGNHVRHPFCEIIAGHAVVSRPGALAPPPVSLAAWSFARAAVTPSWRWIMKGGRWPSG
jgi:hypothetical protein